MTTVLWWIVSLKRCRDTCVVLGGFHEARERFAAGGLLLVRLLFQCGSMVLSQHLFDLTFWNQRHIQARVAARFWRASLVLALLPSFTLLHPPMRCTCVRLVCALLNTVPACSRPGFSDFQQRRNVPAICSLLV